MRFNKTLVWFWHLRYLLLANTQISHSYLITKVMLVSAVFQVMTMQEVFSVCKCLSAGIELKWSFIEIIRIKKKHSMSMVYIHVFKMSFLEPTASESPEKLKRAHCRVPPLMYWITHWSWNPAICLSIRF